MIYVCERIASSLGTPIKLLFQIKKKLVMEVQIVGDVGFVWNLDNVMLLRNKYRIMGSFVGSSPKSLEIGLPLQLLGEEIQLLKEKGIVQLVELKSLEKEPRDSFIQRYDSYSRPLPVDGIT